MMDASQKPPKDQRKKQKKQRQQKQKQTQQQQQPQQNQRQLKVKDPKSANYINCKLLPKWLPLGEYKINTKTAVITFSDQVSDEQLNIVQAELNKIVLLKENVALPFCRIYENELNFIKKEKKLFYGVTLDQNNTVRCLWNFDYFMEPIQKKKNMLLPKDDGKGSITFNVYGTNGEDMKVFINKIIEFKKYQKTFDLTENERDDKFNVDWMKYRKSEDVFRIYFMKGKIMIEAISNEYLQEAIGYVEKERKLYSERF